MGLEGPRRAVTGQAARRGRGVTSPPEAAPPLRPTWDTVSARVLSQWVTAAQTWVLGGTVAPEVPLAAHLPGKAPSQSAGHPHPDDPRDPVALTTAGLGVGGPGHRYCPRLGLECTGWERGSAMSCRHPPGCLRGPPRRKADGAVSDGGDANPTGGSSARGGARCPAFAAGAPGGLRATPGHMSLGFLPRSGPTDSRPEPRPLWSSGAALSRVCAVG